MPVGGVLLVRLREPPDGGDLSRWRRDFLGEFAADDSDCIGLGGPLLVVKAGAGPDPLEDGSTWLDVGLERSYYGEGYERGDPTFFVRVAEWLERRIPDSEIWYGNDIADDTIKPFGAAERADLLAYFQRVGHEPYDAKFRHLRRN